jgi:toxin ParE1/3/4
MATRIVFLEHAQQDLFKLKHYLIENFSKKTWQDTYDKIKTTIQSLRTFPDAGGVPPKLLDVHFTQYRQIISGMHRIIYEIHADMIYIHIICDSRTDFTSLLMKRLLRV